MNYPYYSSKSNAPPQFYWSINGTRCILLFLMEPKRSEFSECYLLNNPLIWFLFYCNHISIFIILVFFIVIYHTWNFLIWKLTKPTYIQLFLHNSYYVASTIIEINDQIYFSFCPVLQSYNIKSDMHLVKSNNSYFRKQLQQA